MWDWADGEPDIDLTKSYPFPVPRICNLSSEFAMPSCDSELECISSKVAMKDSSTAPTIDDTSQVSLICSESSDSQKPTKNQAKTLSHPSSDSQLFRDAHKTKVKHTTFHPHHSAEYNTNTMNLPRHTRGITYHRATRRVTVIKTIAAEPPDATQDDVSKARLKLQISNQALHVA